MVAINNTTQKKINERKINTLVAEFLRVYKKSAWEVSIAVVGSARMRRLNNDYRGIDKATDVLSFGADGSPYYLGEVIINIEETKKAGKYLDIFGEKKSSDYVFYFLLIHGLLHLVGYNDEIEAERLKMLSVGSKFIEKYF